MALICRQKYGIFETERFWSVASDEIIEWALPIFEQSKSDVYYYVATGALQAANLKLIKLLLSKEAVDSEEIYLESAQKGHLHVLKWAQEANIKCEWWDGVCRNAAQWNHLDILDWVFDTVGYLWDGDLQGIDLKAIQWFLAKGRKWDKSMARGYCRDSGFIILQWAHLNGYDIGDDICYFAAKRESLEELKWAKSEGFPWDSTVCSIAAKNGDLKCLIWARENGCDWNEDTCDSAAKKGNLDCLIWARINGCPWNMDILKSNNESVLRYVRANCEDSWRQTQVYLNQLKIIREK